MSVRRIRLIVTAVETATEPGHFVFSASDSFDAKVSVVTAMPPSVGSTVVLEWLPS